MEHSCRLRQVADVLGFSPGMEGGVDVFHGKTSALKFFNE
jgi:hypothetical protein